MGKHDWENNEEIQIFREYLRIPSVHPNVDYTACVDFLKRQATRLNLSLEIIYPNKESNPCVLMKWQGQQPELPAILLNSHMDVVPVFADKWTHDPFAAHMDEEGRIYARGAQDMKCVSTQYLGAIRALKAAGFQPRRTLYLSFVPEEEAGPNPGMLELVQADYMHKLNIGFSLDEGISSENEIYNVFYAERTLWHVRFKISGTSGHGSLLLSHTAGEKLNYLLAKLMEFRAAQVKLLEGNSSLTIGDVTTVNLTQVCGGVQSNVVPPLLELGVDIRIAVTMDIAAFEKQIRQWCEEAGSGIEFIFETKDEFVPPTKVDATNPYWLTFKQSLDELGLKIRLLVFTGATDSRFIRQVGIPALGFSPINNTPVLLHDHNEYLRADTYLQGIQTYKKIISSLANC